MSIVQISGNTYSCRDLIKGRGGKWQAASKTWAIDDKQWAVLAALDNGRATRGCMIVGGVMGGRTETPQADRPQRLRPAGPCRKCGSYCYGDCEAN